MSLISVIFSIILIDVSICMERIKPTGVNRICVQSKDYVDSSVIFRDEFWVIIDQMYYVYNWYANPFVYKGEGLQEVALKEFDRIDDNDKSFVKRGRYLGGFYQTTFSRTSVDESVDETLSKMLADQPNKRNTDSDEVDEPEPDFDDKLKPFEDIYMSYFYCKRMCKTQVIVYRDEHNNKDKYHFKRMNNMDGTSDGLIEDKKGYAYHSAVNGKFDARGAVDKLLKINLTKVVSLPMVLDFATLTLFVIINQKDSFSEPRLYYNSFKYRQFSKTWRYVPIPKGYRYNAFIPSVLPIQPLQYFDEVLNFFTYNVIAEPFRDTKTDKERGPSFLFKLEIPWKKLELNSSKPKLIKLPKGGMSLFECKFISTSSLILYISFGLIIMILALILVVMVAFVAINYLTGKHRIVIVKRNTLKREQSEPKQSRAASLDRTRLRHKSSTGTTNTTTDKRSAHQSLETDKKTTTSVKKIKI